MTTSHSNILLVEDDPLHAQIIEGMILSEGGRFRLECVDRLDGALDRLAGGDVDLILVDLSLPDSDGLETFAALHANFPNIPVVVITATGDEEVATSALQAGAQDFLIKWQMNAHLLQRSMRYAIERQRHDAALRESEERNRDLIENSGLYIGIHDVNGKILSVNRAVLDFLGLSADDLIGRNVADFLPERGRRLFRDYLDSLREQGRSEGMAKFKSPDGQSIILEYTNSVSRDASGALVVRSVGRDVTKRARAEAELRESEERLRLALTAAQMGAWEWNLATDRIIGDEYVRTLLELQDGGLDGFVEKVHPDNRQSVLDGAKSVVENKDLHNLQFRILDTAGRERWIELNASLRTDHLGEPVRVIGVLQDITERKQSDESYRHNEERMHQQAALLDNAQDAIIVRDLNDQVLYWSRGAQRLYGWSFDEARGRKLTEMLHREPPPETSKARHALFSQGAWSGELRQVTKDGREIVVQGRWSLLRDAGERPKSVLVINTDITEKKRLESMVLRAQRLESIGALASGIAHDLNNVLAPILMALHTLQQRFTDESSQRWLSLIHKSAERGRDLIDQVLSFAKGAEGERSPLQISHLIKDISKILRETLPKNIDLQVIVPEGVWAVIGDTTQIHQVLMNLCINARDAMPDGGRLQIKARNRFLVEEEERLVTNPQQKQYVRITVADTGVGIPAEIIDRVFDPFFTTKEKGHGSGLGLSTVQGIVRGHGGFVNVLSQVGKGTEFKIYLPAQDIPAAEMVEDGHAPLPTGNGELILVVDDEADIREVTSRTLESNGYRVVVARDGREAVEMYRKRKGEISLVLTDMVMPNLDGPGTIRALKQLDPNVLVVATSGVRTTGKLAEATQVGAKTFLPKPYTAERLLLTIANAFEEERVRS